ncbi:MAG: preprotein translocase subunit SecG [Bacteroidota bacterium]|nr:preprotein translocase subunit SecG [Bacteroidota bacterium]MDP4213315.1 preprotein translocase subunit SecG [Bacteroidota bacterium]MDP4251790.1 preprotein translocase subunit SecG [Bacteroidota bacterium]
MIFFVILLLLACILLGLIILIQNPKGGGLAGNVAGFSNQFMGVKQTNNVLEKGTWILAIIVALFCIFSTLIIPKAGATRGRDFKAAPTSTSTGNLPQLPAPTK